jgi:hypothetical protein
MEVINEEDCENNVCFAFAKPGFVVEQWSLR